MTTREAIEFAMQCVREMEQLGYPDMRTDETLMILTELAADS